jgi:hypothetical protein
MTSAMLAKMGNKNFMPTSFFALKSCQHYFIQRLIQSAVLSLIRSVIYPQTAGRKPHPFTKVSTAPKVGIPPISRVVNARENIILMVKFYFTRGMVCHEQ